MSFSVAHLTTLYKTGSMLKRCCNYNKLQQSQIILLQEEQKRLTATLDVQSQKLDQFTEFQDFFQTTHEVGKEVGKVVAHEVEKVFSQELSKVVVHGVGKANRHLVLYHFANSLTLTQEADSISCW